MALQRKQVTCECGNTIEIDMRRDWCDKCGKPVYYHEKERHSHKINQIYVLVSFLLGIGFLVYLFVETVVRSIPTH